MGANAGFGQFLRERRKGRDLTQEELARQIGYSVSTIRKIELGVLRPSRDLLDRLAEALQLDADQHAELIRRARLPDVSSNRPSARRSDVPTPLTSLLGRDAELSHLIDLLSSSDVRLVTLVGPGGAGKTRLAIEAAWRVRDAFPDGVLWVDLAPLRDAGLVLSAIGRVLDLPEIRTVEQIQSALRERRVLLLLDNFEHVQTAAKTVAQLQGAAPGLKVLATSRVLLRVRGEWVMRLAPLALPATPPARAVTAQAYAAVQLFIERAQAVDPGFRLTDENAHVVAEICARLDGLPLAIELAAARVNLFSPRALLARLDHPLRMLTDGAPDLPDRQQTLEAAIGWSYTLLPPDARCMFARLAVFAGGAAMSAVESLVVDLDGMPGDVLHALGTLVDSSLLRREVDTDGEPRFTMLQTIRDYALERLAASEEAQRVYRAHAAYFAALAEAARPRLRRSEQKRWLELLQCEHDNLRAALQWSLKQAEHTMTLRLAAALPRFWWMRGFLAEGRATLQQVLHTVGEMPASVHARLLYWQGVFDTYLGDYDAAYRELERCIALGRAAADLRVIAQASNALGMVANAQGDHRRALRHYAAGLAVYRKLGDDERIATLLNNLGYTAILADECEDALPLLQESLALAGSIDDRLGIAYALNNLGLLALRQYRHGDAYSLLLQALQIFASLADARNSAECLESLAEIASATGYTEDAARFLAAADMLRARSGTMLTPRERSRHESLLGLVRGSLHAGQFDVAWDEGLEMDLDQIVAFVAAREAAAGSRAADS